MQRHDSSLGLYVSDPVETVVTSQLTGQRYHGFANFDRLLYNVAEIILRVRRPPLDGCQFYALMQWDL